MRVVGLLGFAALAFAACTDANVGDGNLENIGDVETPDAGPGGGGEDGPDAGGGEPTDPVPVTLAHNLNDSVVAGKSIACVEQNADGVPIQHRDNSYYRTFDLAALGVTRDLDVEFVTFGVESASSPDGTQPATLTLYTLREPPLLIENLDVLATTPIEITNQTGTLYNAPIAATVPAGSTLVVELFVPDSAGQNRLFFLGSNSGGQTAPTFLRATATGCDIAQPTDLAALGFPTSHGIIKVTGSF